jgi:hypothetical protein
MPIEELLALYAARRGEEDEEEEEEQAEGEEKDAMDIEDAAATTAATTESLRVVATASGRTPGERDEAEGLTAELLAVGNHHHHHHRRAEDNDDEDDEGRARFVHPSPPPLTPSSPAACRWGFPFPAL